MQINFKLERTFEAGSAIDRSEVRDRTWFEIECASRKVITFVIARFI